jgi:hypothetical protein
MKIQALRLLPLAIAAALAACGGEQEIVTTNSGNVVPGGRQADMNFTNDEPANMTAGRPMDANEIAAMNATDANAANGM